MSDGQNTATLIGLLKTVAPGLATALGGPLAGAAVGFIASRFGVPVDKVQEVVAGMSPDQLIRMKELDYEFQKSMAENGIKIDIAQIETNKVEAASESLFVAGWRPFVGWICGAGLAYAAIILPILEFVSRVIFGYDGKFPVMDWAILSNVLLGMLGLGAMRSYDKRSGNGNGH